MSETLLKLPPNRRLPAQIGKHLLERDLEKALVYYDEEVELFPEERCGRLGRAVARGRNLNVNGGLKDIETILKANPGDFGAHALNNELLFLKKKFEKALMLNEKFLRLRKYPDNFFMGQMKCRDAILNTISKSRAGHPLRDHYLIIRRKALEESVLKYENSLKLVNKKSTRIFYQSIIPQKDSETENILSTLDIETLSSGSLSPSISASEVKMDLDFPSVKTSKTKLTSIVFTKNLNFPYKPLQRITTNLTRYMSEKYLGILYRDKIFLERLLLDKGLSTPNHKGETIMEDLIGRGNAYLKRLQKFMRSKCPFYYINYQERKIRARVNAQKEMLLAKKHERIQNTFQETLCSLRNSYERKDLKKIMQLVENLIQLYAPLPKSIVTKHNKNIIEAFRIVGDAHFNFILFSHDMTEQEKINRVKFILGIRLERQPSTDSLIKNLKDNIPVDCQSKMKFIENRLKTASFLEEIIFLNYELARYNLHVGKYDLVRNYAIRCSFQARKHKLIKWVINANLLMIKAGIKQSNKLYALKYLEKSLLLSKTMDNPSLIHFLKFAIKVVQDTNFTLISNPKAEMRKRGKSIIRLLEENSPKKREAKELFRRLSSAPLHRTISVIPGVIMPSGPKGGIKNVSPYLHVKGVEIDERRGCRFLELIRDYMNEDI